MVKSKVIYSSTSKLENRPHIILEKDSERTIMYHATCTCIKLKQEIRKAMILLIDKRIDL